jgi:hypothetical protein
MVSPKVFLKKRKIKKFGGNPTPPAPFYTISYTPNTLLYYILIARLLATFYTLSFLDYIHEATHLLTLLIKLLTYINLLNLQYIY